MDGSSVIALVASKGGLAAVSQVLSGLPAGFPAAIVVLIHQQPDHLSSLPQIFGPQTPLEVVAVEDGAPLEPGRVVVAPPGSHTLITPLRKTVLVVSGAPPPSRPSADLLLTSMALSVGPEAVAVVLTGGGHDGATGATAVHKLGGTVLATDEATSEAFSMPHATIEREGIIDHVVPLGGVAERLVSLVSAPRPS